MRIALSIPILFILALATLTAAAHAQVTALHVPPTSGQPADENVPETIELTVSPAPEPRPALKYRLLPSMPERKPGNAATYYYRALLQQQMLPKEYVEEFAKNEERWLTSDSQTYPREEVGKWLAGQHLVLSQVKVAAFREECDWDFRIQDLSGLEPISFLLHDVQECRQLARVLRLKAHHEIMEGQSDEAFQTLRQGYQLAHDVTQQPLLINALVGIAIASIMNQELVLWIESRPENLYWAIASLPDPLVSMRPAMQYEMHMPYRIFPFLQDAETVQRSPQEWQRLMVDCLRNLEGLHGGQPKFSEWQAELVAAAAAAKMYPVAKQQLIEQGMDRDEVEAMPVGQVIAIQTARATDYAYHEVFKVALLPYDEASRRLPEVEKRLIQEGYLGPRGTLSGKVGLPIASLILPAIHAAMEAEGRLRRNFASLKAIEAIRMHAAEHGGKLPEELADVTIVPVPNNPATGEPFPYQYDAASGTATLDVPPIGARTPRQDGKRYVIKLKKSP